MQTKNIISVAAVVASFAGAALAGTPVKIVAPTPVPAPVATSSPLSGDIYAGYASNYTCRGIVASHALAEGDSVIPAGVNLNYKLCDANSIVASASYTTLTSGHHLMGDRDTSFHNETNFNLGWQNKDGLLKNLSTTLGWNLIHGGLLGSFAKYDHAWRYRRNFNESGVSASFPGTDFLSAGFFRNPGTGWLICNGTDRRCTDRAGEDSCASGNKGLYDSRCRRCGKLHLWMYICSSGRSDLPL